MSQQVPDPPPQQQGSSPLFLIGVGLFMFAAAAGLFFYFVHLEQTGGSATMHAAVALLYNLGGKWTVAVVLSLLGLVSLLVGIAELFKPKK